MILNDSGKNILITGASSGIGFYALVNLLKKENHLYIPVRSFIRGQDLKLKLGNFFNNDFLNKFLNLIVDTDFSDLKNIYKIREFIIEKKKTIDVLILNAGIQYTGGYILKFLSKE